MHYFTVVTHKRNPLLIENIKLLKESFKNVKNKYSFEIIAIVILPDHLHMLLRMKNVTDYPKIIGTLKRYFSQKCPEKYYQCVTQSKSREQQNYKPIWQKRFYEHAIRDEKKFQIKMDYIHFNPIKHGLVEKLIDWKHSSFEKFVRQGVYPENWVDFNSSVNFE